MFNHLYIVHQNIDGLISKSDELLLHLETIDYAISRFDVLCITEHNMISEDKTLLNIPNFVLASSYHRANRAGGSCILVRNNHQFKTLPAVKNNSISNIIECSGIELTEHNLIILCIYRHPPQTKKLEKAELFFAKLTDILYDIGLKNKKLVICGDFNINRLKSNNISKKFELILKSFNLKLSINKPTRHISGTCLDNIAHNVRGAKSSVHELSMSDHTAQILKCPIKKTYSIAYWYKLLRDYSESNIVKFMNCLQSLHFTDSYLNEDPNESFNQFYELFQLFYNLCFPVLRKKISLTKNVKWLSKGLRLCSKRKRELLWKYRICKSPGNKEGYKSYAKRLRSIIKQTQRAQNNYYINSSKNKTKATWNVINSSKPNVPPKEISEIKIGNRSITDAHDIACEFNNYFIGEKSPTKLDKAYISKTLRYNSPDSFFMKPTTVFEINHIITSLSNSRSTGYDDIQTHIVKKVSTIISPILSSIINKCLEKGVFPQKLKTTIITPLHKKNDKTDMCCYRPIALIPIFAKIFEKVIYNSLNRYFENKNILVKEQCGFRRGKSTNTAIYNFLMDVFNALDNRKRVTAIFMDLTKAFDHVDHNILLYKLEKYGIRGNTLDLLKSYLNERVQYTEVVRIMVDSKIEQKFRSDARIVQYGVPQGSILGPLLFIIYINDVPNAIEQPCILFADDSTAIYVEDNPQTYELEINSSLETLINWFNANNLKINLSKTSYMTFQNKNKCVLPLKIAYKEETLIAVNNARFLGIDIDSNLDWKSHINNLCSKLHQFSYALYMLKKVSNISAVLTVYHAYVGSSLKYGIMFWGNSTDKDRPFIAQKRCIRAIAGIKVPDTCKPYFVKYKILTLPSIYIFEAALMVIKNLQNYEKLKSKRLNHILCAKKSRTTKYSKSIYCMEVQIYNKIPNYIKANPIYKFKILLKEFLTQKAYYSIDEFLKDRI